MPRSLPPLILAACLLIAAPSRVHRDWKSFPAVAQSDSKSDVYVVGDVHGDYQRLAALLTGTGVIQPGTPDPKHPTWKAGGSILVFTGDLIDKGQHALDAIDLIKALQTQAAAQGGRVYVLMGNHEAEFLADPTSDKVQDFANELRARGLNPVDVANCGTGVGTFLCTEPFGLRIRNWFFSHAGNTNGRTLAKLTADLQNGVDSNGFETPELVGGNSLLEARLNEKGPGGGLWLEDGPGHDAQALLKSYAAALGVAHFVEGHQPGKVQFSDGIERKKGQMFQRFGLIFLVDTGMSEAINDSQGALLLIKAQPTEEAIAICPNGSRTSLWSAKSAQPVGRAAACGR